MNLKVRCFCRGLKAFVISAVVLLGVTAVVLLTTGSRKRQEEQEYNIRAEGNGSLVVHTTAGLVQGVEITAHGRTLHAYYGIPYADPPVGELRFLHPVRRTPSKKVTMATEMRPACPQESYWFSTEYVNSSSFDEDCLHLNLWTPSVRANDALRPVVVYLHGGGFQNGGNNLRIYDGSHFSALGDVVVVVPNYRVNVFGFLYVGTSDAPGNQGLWDQRLALLWVRDNARAFGGDPEQVTLMGQSAGSISVGYHVLSPLTRHLFRRAIMQSGTPFYKVEENQITGPEKARRIAARLCGPHLLRRPMAHVVECLRNQTTQKLLGAVKMVLGLKASSFIPVSGDDLLPKDPLATMANGSAPPVDLLIGVNENEGTYFLYKLYQTMGITDPFVMSNRQHVTIVKLLVNYALWEAPEDLIEGLLANVHDGTSTPDIVRHLADGIGDVAMRCPTQYFSEFVLRQRGSHLYQYEYGYRPLKASFWPPWMGVTHFDEFPFVWGYVFDRPELATPRDTNFSQMLIGLWSSFVHNRTMETGKTLWPANERQLATTLRLVEQPRVQSAGSTRTCSLLRRYIVPYRLNSTTNAGAPT
ncbi:hypothetical protein MTO96_025740 [Rhipicephalus appendiculatus]